MSECFDKARELGQLIVNSKAGVGESDDDLRFITEQAVAIIRATVYGTLELHGDGCGSCRMKEKRDG